MNRPCPVLTVSLLCLCACSAPQPPDGPGPDLTAPPAVDQGPAEDLGSPGADLSHPDLKRCALAAQWQVADELPMMTGARTTARHLVSDGRGTIWVSGQFSDAMNSGTWLVRRSTDGGMTWGGMDGYRYAAGQPSGAPALLRARVGGALLLAGWMSDGSGVEHWIVRRSADGVSFTTVDDFSYVSGKYSAAFHVADTAAGHLYVAGYGLELNDTRHWLLRRSTNGGTSWSTVDDFVYAGGRRSEALAATEAAGGVVAVGFGNDGGAHRWIARRSTGGAFTTVDDFALAAGQDAQAAHVVAAPGGMTLYAIGTAVSDLGLTFWVVRRSTDGGASWTTVDRYRHENLREARGAYLYIDRDGVVYALGDGLELTGRYSWVVRRSTDGGATWQPVDTYTGHAGQGAQPRGMLQDERGDLLVAGASAQMVGSSRWMVRRLRCE